MERDERIKQKLAQLGEDYDAIKPFMQRYLAKVEDHATTQEIKQQEAIKTLKGGLYNVSDVSDELGCSRTTFYNHNQLLKRYIEMSIDSLNKENPYFAFEKIKESNQRLQNQVYLMENRDIDKEIEKHEKKLLMERISEQNKEIERLQARVNELSAELHQMKIKGASEGSIIRM